MPSLILYIVKLSAALALIWGFYQLLLRRLTFYTCNRWYLIGYSVLAFIFPLVNVESLVDKGPVGENGVIQYIPSLGQYMTAGPVVPAAVVKPAFDWNRIVLWVMVAGALVLLMRMVIRWLSLVRIRRSARLVEVEGMRIYEIGGDISPFSFGKAVYINPLLHTEKEWDEIILHEYVHIRQNHTLDILLAELLCILNWYSPFSWLIRRSIRQNLEFIADRQVLSNGVDRVGYQYHLLKVLGEPRYRLANNFNFSSLKKRIIMMNKMRSARLHLVKFLFIVPLAAVLLVAFRDKYADWWRPAAGQVYVNVAGIVFDVSSKDPLAGVTVWDSRSGLQTTTDDRGFYKLHIPAMHDSIRVELKFYKAEYDSGIAGHYIPMLKNNLGMIDNVFLSNPRHPFKGFFGMVLPPQGPIAEDPDYTDATAALHDALQWNDNYAQYLKAQKEHGITLFYTSEDRPHDIIFLQDGTMEKYGYPGTAPLEAMEKKYGFPADIFGNSKGRRVNEGYIARWRAISAEAEKTFHTDNPDVRAVVFPGDSRVIVVPVKGKPRVFDMDNAAEVERSAFEKLYGRLPDCVPPPANNTDEREKAVRSGVRIIVGSGASGAGGVVGTGNEGTRKDTMPNSGKRKLPTNVLYVLDGEQMPAGWTADRVPTDSIGSIVVLQAGKALTFFGPRGENGAIVLRTKAYEAAHPIAVKDDEKRGNPAKLFSDSISEKMPPLWVVNGQIWSNDSVKTLNPGRIDHIDVHKGDEYAKQYGEKGNNGVIEITLKPKGTGALPNGAGTITMNGESHVEGNGKAIGVANGPREGQAQVIFDNGKQVAIADTIKMNGLIITTYRPGGN